MSTYTGTIPTFLVAPVRAAALHELDLALKALTDAWSPYLVAWTSSGTQPAIGNGTLEGKYFRAGKQVAVHIKHVMGSTTTYGTGQYFWSLPVAARVSNYPLACYMLDNGTANKAGLAVVTSGLSTLFAIQNTTDVAATAPHTWANTDRLDLVGIYEVA